MGQIDVSDVLSDPDMLDACVLVHRTPFINEFGENVLREQGEQTYGSVQPASGKVLQRLPEALRVPNVMSFLIKGKIVSDGTQRYPDIISFRGQRYAVQVIFDWTSWGEGYCEGTATRERPAP